MSAIKIQLLLHRRFQVKRHFNVEPVHEPRDILLSPLRHKRASTNAWKLNAISEITSLWGGGSTRKNASAHCIVTATIEFSDKSCRIVLMYARARQPQAMISTARKIDYER